mgnify:CR=1 FL=1
MLNSWLDKDDTIDLSKLFLHFEYDKAHEELTHTIFNRNSRYRVVIYTDRGFLYYHVENPEKKYSASSLIIEEVSRIEGKKNESLWDKVNDYYSKVINSKDLVLNNSDYKNAVKVSLDFNHFLSYNIPLKTHRSDLYSNISQSNSFQNRIFESTTGEPIFPLFNIENEVTGYFADGKNGVDKFRESDTKNSLWYSNVPDVIEWIVLFNNPKEAVAFHNKFNLENAVYIALGEINYETTDILFKIQRDTKVKKIILSFTGYKKIEGYLRDLNFMSFMDISNFNLKLKDNEIKISIKKGEKNSSEEKSFVRFYNSTKSFNQGLTNSFLKYNKVIDQNRLNKHFIIVEPGKDSYVIRVPLEVNAIKYFVWSYYKNYLSKSIEILKPKQINWVMEWESDQSLTLKGKEEVLENYKIAL